MFETLFGIVVGLVIGWNLPQPQWAKDLQEKITGFFRK
jgi:hypothetical protein